MAYNFLADMQGANIGNALAQGDANAAQMVGNRQQRQLRNFLAENGGALRRGDPAALDGYASIAGAENALGIQDARQTMDVRANQDRREEARLAEELRMKAEKYAEGAAQAAAAQSAQENEADLAVLSNAAGYLRMDVNDPANVRAALDALVQADPTAAQKFLGPRGEIDVQELALAVEHSRRGLLRALGEPDPMLEQGEAERDIRNVDGVLYEIPAEGEPIPLTAARDRAPLVSIGGQETALPEPPAGYAWRLDPQTRQPIIDPQTGTGVLVPVAGGPKDTSAKDALRDEGTMRSSGIVLDDIGRVRDMLTGGRMQPVTGAFGAAASLLPGSEARDARALSDTIRANIGFDRLNQMRAESPTGGALGNVTERELAFLQAVLGSLDFTQSKDQLLQNLNRLEQVYLDIQRKIVETGDGTPVPGFTDGNGRAGGQPAGDDAPPPGVDPGDWAVLTPELRDMVRRATE